MKPLQLESLERLGWRFGLETMGSLLDELGNPHLSQRFIHVAGSNGKGSTCAFMASFLKKAGYRTGLYTSPHLSDIRERFRINGEWIPSSDLKTHTGRVLAACQKVKKKLGHYPTHFEALTAIAFSWFEEQKVDWVVLEVGLGGRLDATNIIPKPVVALISSIGLEHQDILGKTIGKIAMEKAGIIKENGFAATVQTHPEALKALQEQAARKNAKLWTSDRDFHFRIEKRGFRWVGPGFRGSFRFPDMPPYQIANAALALAGIQYLRTCGIEADPETIQRSFSLMRWPGRLETLQREPLILLDGAHNPDAAKVLASSLSKNYPRKRWVVLNGFLKDKDYRTFSRILKPFTEVSIVTEPPSDRKEGGQKVFEAWESGDVRTFLVKDWEKALTFAGLKSASSSLGLLITGSFYLGGACRRALIGLKGLEKI